MSKEQKNPLSKIDEHKDVIKEVRESEKEHALKMAVAHAEQYKFQKLTMDAKKAEVEKIKDKAEKEQKLQQLAQNEMQTVIPYREKAVHYYNYYEYLCNLEK